MNKIDQSNTELALGVDPRKKPHFFQKMIFFITLRQSGNNLLTNGAKGYLVAMSVIMTLVAIAEGVAWGYFGTAFIPTNPMVAGLTVGTFIFLLIWFFDRILLTADFMEHQHRVCLNGDSETTEDKLKLKATQRNLKVIFVARLLVALFSLYIAAPYVTQLVFNADIQNKQQQYFQQAVLDVKQKYQDGKEAELKQLAAKIDQTNQKLQAEIAGGQGSLSGRYGRGESALAIQEELTALEGQHQQVAAESKQHIQRIEQALKDRDYQELAALDIRVDKDSPILRRKAIADIEQQYPKEFNEVEHTVQGLLLILAVILLGMKLMQSNAVKLYLSSNLQSKWNLYCLGKYDVFLLEAERRHVLLNSQEALPEEFEQMIIAVATKKQQLAHIDAMERKNAEDKKADLIAEAEKNRLAKEASLNAEQGYFERLAIETSTIEKREREKSIFEAQIEKSLLDVKQIEQDYLQKHAVSIAELESAERQLIDELHELEKQFKTQQERIDARLQRIDESETDMRSTEVMLQQIRQSEHLDRIETLRTIETYETALMNQKDRLRGQRAELLGFQSNQKFYEENSHLSRQRLQAIQLQLGHLKQPLHKIDEARAAVEMRRIQFVMDQGLMESPLQSPTPAEIPYLVEKLRDQMTTAFPM